MFLSLRPISRSFRSLVRVVAFDTGTGVRSPFRPQRPKLQAFMTRRIRSDRGSATSRRACGGQPGMPLRL